MSAPIFDQLEAEWEAWYAQYCAETPDVDKPAADGAPVASEVETG